MKTVLFATAAACAVVSFSQAAQAAPAGNNAALDEVVVTAEKREQKNDKVPEAITAFTSKQRDLIGLDSMQDYTNFTPGLSYSSGNDRLFLRGVHPGIFDTVDRRIPAPLAVEVEPADDARKILARKAHILVGRKQHFAKA